ncbi:triphosphoribosyl-dephospho-CoA synthase CitG [Lactobacillus agrestimuris]|uniref:triphosphoribosyl-dephospho-CoA synthase CitG n=1 Tax=Lactobacillus agrestimuris TaxID=2941328 RepID=UPI002043F0CA|nr:triphosphoribosyl-dephospho-CoA synthase CitG [Lactobacillus agrestimuris]
MIEQVVSHAIEALLYEAVTNPKPGLVDPSDPGSHKDMDIYTFIDSSVTMRTYLINAARVGFEFNEDDLTKMFNQLRRAGMSAEKVMFETTDQVNTHKGAIFSLGIFVCAKTYSDKHDLLIYDVIRAMCAGLVKNDLQKKENFKTAGELQYLKYGQGGVRELAESGYPIIENYSLPFLKESTGTINQRLLDTLMAIASVTIDSTFIKRAGGIEKVEWLHEQGKKFLELGGSKSEAGMQFLLKLNQVFKDNNYSIGGCADLLIVTIFMALELDYI